MAKSGKKKSLTITHISDPRMVQEPQVCVRPLHSGADTGEQQERAQSSAMTGSARAAGSVLTGAVMSPSQ